MVTMMRMFDAITDPIIGAMMDAPAPGCGKFRPFMVLGSRHHGDFHFCAVLPDAPRFPKR